MGKEVQDMIIKYFCKGYSRTRIRVLVSKKYPEMTNNTIAIDLSRAAKRYMEKMELDNQNTKK